MITTHRIPCPHCSPSIPLLIQEALTEASEYLRHGTPIHPGSDVAGALLAAARLAEAGPPDCICHGDGQVEAIARDDAEKLRVFFSAFESLATGLAPTKAPQPERCPCGAAWTPLHACHTRAAPGAAAQ